jgi:hypothetical protein
MTMALANMQIVISQLRCPYRVRSARATPRRGLERQLLLNGFRDDFRELYNAQSVEALKGPSAITFGRNAVTRTVERLRRLSRPLSRGGRCRQ